MSGPSDYVVEKKLGKGKFGHVYKSIKKDTSDVYAVKVISKKSLRDNELKNQLVTELKILSITNHKNLIKFFEYFDNEFNHYIVTSYVDGSDLYEKIIKPKIKISEDKVRKYISGVVSAVEYLHEHKIIHRDIKPENVLLNSDDNIVVCDFGWSKIVQTLDQKMDQTCGTLDYLCPEIVKMEPYDHRCDFWNIGVLTYELLTFKVPFMSWNIKDTYDKISNIEYEIPEMVSENCLDFIKGLLKYEKDRLRLDGIKYHPWLV